MYDECCYQIAQSKIDAGYLETACGYLEDITSYKDSGGKYKECCYQIGQQGIADKNYEKAYKYLIKIKGYKDVDTLLRTEEMRKIEQRYNPKKTTHTYSDESNPIRDRDPEFYDWLEERYNNMIKNH